MCRRRDIDHVDASYLLFTLPSIFLRLCYPKSQLLLPRLFCALRREGSQYRAFSTSSQAHKTNFDCAKRRRPPLSSESHLRDAISEEMRGNMPVILRPGQFDNNEVFVFFANQQPIGRYLRKECWTILLILAQNLILETIQR